jgi:hypothetical protein
MCEWKSAVVDRSGKVWMHDLVDSHSDLVALFGLPSHDADALQCVEDVPASPDKVLDFDAYTFRLDNERCSWWTDEIQERVIGEMRDWIKARVIDDDGAVEHLIVCKYAILCGKARARLYFARVALYGNASARLYGNASARLYGNASARLTGNASARLTGNASAALYDNASAALYDNASARLYGNASATPCDCGCFKGTITKG